MRYFSLLWKLCSKNRAAVVFLLSIPSAFFGTSLFAADVNIAVNASIETSTIPDEIFGQNLAVWESTVDGYDQQLNKLMAASGTRFVRYPGGSYADIVMWETVGISPSTAWMRSTEDCIRFANSYGAKLQVIVNFSGYWDNTQHTREETVAKAAEQVKYMNITKKLGIKYWEIGNESGGYWEQGHTNALDYGSRFADFYTAMKAVDPTILIGAVSDPYDNEPQANDTWVMRDMFAGAKKKGVIPDFLIIHTYPNYESMSPENDSKMMTYPDTIAILTANLDAMVKKYVGQEYVGKIKYFMTEYRSSLGNKLQLLTYADAMFTAQYIMEMARYGWAGANIWDIKNGIDTVNGADYGIISQSWRFEAESGTLKAPAKATSEIAGYSGGGYVTGFADNSMASVAFDVDVAKEGSYNIIFHYSNGLPNFQKLSVYVNNIHVKDVSFPITGDWKAYFNYAEPVRLPAGRSVLSFSSEKGAAR
jgi:hypothetical protein